MSNILQYIQEHQNELQLPWTGLSLLIAKDDAASLDIDYIERVIRIDCSDIAAQWIFAFQRISQEHLQTMKEIQLQIETLQYEIEQVFRYWIEKSKQHLSLPSLSPNITINIQRGFTCSQRRYAEWLGKIQREIFTLESKSSGHPSSFPSSSALSRGSPEMEIAPLRLNFIIEDSHGTKLLVNGSFQIDVNTSATQIKELIQRNLGSAIDQIKHQQVIDEKTINLQSQLVHRLELLSISRGKGVQEDQYLFALQNLLNYLHRKNARNTRNRGILKHLSGVRVIIGHYHGIRDDGACLLPWNFKILETL